jgi:phospholipase C
MFADAASAEAVDVRISASRDDAEEGSDGEIVIASSDLELVRDRGDEQTVGMRFTSVAIPQGASITEAYIQFTVDQTTRRTTDLTIVGEASDSATIFSNESFDISSRPRTTADVGWAPPSWTTVGAAGPEQRTPNLAPIIQEIVNRPGWSSGNPLVITISGSGKRVAESYNGDQAAAPLLHVEFNSASSGTATPIEHVIVLVGENRSFDHLFGVYTPGAGQSIDNLLSRGIVNADGSPGPNFFDAAQNQAVVTGMYSITPPQTGPYATLPQPSTIYAKGQPHALPDQRFPDDLPNGPFQITHHIDYDDYAGDPVHRFFQMWQQVDRGPLDLVVWVAETAGEGPDSLTNPTATCSDSNFGGEGMGFYNMTTGDAPYFKSLAQQYAISDNFHQGFMGGTGANYFYLATGDVAFFNEDGALAAPWPNQIENPDPQPGTNNCYTQDGYAGGSYVKCADRSQPGVAPIRDYLDALPYAPFRNGNCAADTYYLVNNYKPGYFRDGTPRPLGPNEYTTPPQTVPTIAESLSSKGVSWKWYSGGRNNANGIGYCSICDPLTHSTAVMTSSLKDNLQGLSAFWDDVADEATMPAVSFIAPPNGKSGHPGNSTVAKFEDLVERVVNNVQANPALWASTAIFITFDEGGGYYDSGYIQPIDFFGDGPRMPFIVVSPHARAGYVDHTYYNLASILKFIQANWGLTPLSERSHDGLPNPVTGSNPYVPVNSPAIGDLMNLFEFSN